MTMNKYLNPKKYLEKAWRCFDKIYYERLYNPERVRAAEKQKFEKAGLNYGESLKKLDQLLKENGRQDFASQKGIGSNHWVIFCGLSLRFPIHSVLEIGTYDGETAFLLSKIFPESEIVTVDLPEDDPLFATTYHRQEDEKRARFRETQAKNTSNPRIEFLQKNSFFIPGLLDKKFDLIWVDAGHLYPEIAWDICNSYHLLNPNGWLMVDDVITDGRGYRNDYESTDSFHVLEYVARRTGDPVAYFVKREAPEWSANPRRRKHVALMQKTGNRLGEHQERCLSG